MLESGQLLHDRYRLSQKLGQNPGRQTWLAEDLQVEPSIPVVVKLLAFGGDVQWEQLKLFEREAQVLKQLDHPRIPKYRDYFSIDDRSLWFGLVETYIPGSSLRQLLHQGNRFTEAELRRIAIATLQILDYLHGMFPPLLHRDLKPGNLILGEDHEIYLVDFGAVQDRGMADGASFTVVGTYGYTPMEQFGGRAVPSSDLYALGMTLMHLAIGIAPADLPQDGLRVQFQFPSHFTPAFEGWVQRLTEPALKQRFATAKEALAALESNTLWYQPVSELPLLPPNNSGHGKLSVPIPPEIPAWNWGAFFLAPLWCLDHRLWWGTLPWAICLPMTVAAAAIPWNPAVFLGLFAAAHMGVASLLGIKGNQWAWQSKKWRSIQQFKDQQRAWTVAGFVLLPTYLPILLPLLLLALL
ncbi:serine/threonine protein kinase [Leptolyngbya sp. 'hensonii']|uniref:protein kinase domain-containing protein n=1 Tax=Leptolyngbya sp. 'hensonii' TaxID=1922337 RepID=UPI00094F6A21|nr:protein kinase [Leptolyngbya sp. 'hensonii']OLP17727.1 serine/threonine protein kinase [Leptolyngbya sp. 'hensonii']